MKRVRGGYRCAALAALAAALAGCGDAGTGSTTRPGAAGNTSAGGGSGGAAAPKVLFITNSNSDWWNAVDKGMTDGGAEFGVAVEMRRNEADVQGQVDKLREALSRPDIQGVAVSVLQADAPGILDAMRALQKAGKVVIAIDSDAAADAADARSAYIGTNNVKAGEAAGRAAAALQPEGGQVVLFVGDQAAANARERKQGFFAGAGAKFKEQETFEDAGDPTKAGTNVQTAISKYPKLNVLLGLWSYNATAIAEQVARTPQMRDQAGIVTFDLDEAARDHIRRKNIEATVCQNPYEMGYQGVKLLKALITKDEAGVKAVLPDGKARDTGVRVVVPDAESPAYKNKGKDDVITIEEMETWLQSKGLRST